MIHLVEHRSPDRPMVEAVVRCAQQETLSFSQGAPMSAALYDKPREILHELGIETMEALFDQLSEIWAYVTQIWMRHTSPTKDKHRERWPTSAWWQEVQSVNFGRDNAFPAMREKQRAFHEKRMFSTILGYVESYAAWKAGEMGSATASNLYGTLAQIVQRSQDHYDENGSNFTTQVKDKRKKIGFAS